MTARDDLLALAGGEDFVPCTRGPMDQGFPRLTACDPDDGCAPPDIVTITKEGRTLLRIGPDGVVEGEIEDMGEAARVFLEELRRLLPAFGMRLADHP